MITLRFSPTWFYGVDILFEILVVIVTILIGVYAYRLYKFSDNYRYKYLALSFWALTVSFMSKVAANYVIYFHRAVKESLGTAVEQYQLTNYSNIAFQIGYDIHRFLLFMGLLGIYWLVSKSKNHEHVWFMTFFLFIITLFSFQAYFVFHLVAAVMLFVIAKHYHKLCFTKGKKKASKHSHFNFMAFVLLFISQIVFTFTYMNRTMYVIAEIIQFMGFATFLINHVALVLKYGKKKNKD